MSSRTSWAWWGSKRLVVGRRTGSWGDGAFRPKRRRAKGRRASGYCDRREALEMSVSDKRGNGMEPEKATSSTPDRSHLDPVLLAADSTEASTRCDTAQ